MKKILHIEDNLNNKLLVERVLEARGYTVVHAPDGESGIEAAVDQDYDLILIDMGLPDIDGQTVVIALQQLPNLQHTPMVAITAWPAEHAHQIAERYGLAGCILKPIDVKSFPQTIAQFLEKGA